MTIISSQQKTGFLKTSKRAWDLGSCENISHHFGGPIGRTKAYFWFFKSTRILETKRRNGETERSRRSSNIHEQSISDARRHLHLVLRRFFPFSPFWIFLEPPYNSFNPLKLTHLSVFGTNK